MPRSKNITGLRNDLSQNGYGKANEEVVKLILEGAGRIEAGYLEMFGTGVQETIGRMRENILLLSEAVQPEEQIIVLLQVCGYLHPMQQIVVLNLAMMEVERMVKIHNSYKLAGIVAEGCAPAMSREPVADPHPGSMSSSGGSLMLMLRRSFLMPQPQSFMGFGMFLSTALPSFPGMTACSAE